jgi:hypothetical protein
VGDGDDHQGDTQLRAVADSTDAMARDLGEACPRSAPSSRATIEYVRQVINECVPPVGPTLSSPHHRRGAACSHARAAQPAHGSVRRAHFIARQENEPGGPRPAPRRTTVRCRRPSSRGRRHRAGTASALGTAPCSPGFRRSMPHTAARTGFSRRPVGHSAPQVRQREELADI